MVRGSGVGCSLLGVGGGAVRWYVGYVRGGGRVAFKTDNPSEARWGSLYFALWGPFYTRRGARFGASWRAVNNPHTVTVAQAEQVAKSLGEVR